MDTTPTAYEVRAEIHAPMLTSEERVTVAAIREYLKLKLRGANLRYALDILASGLVNANDTVFVEHAQPRAEWLSMFISSMELLLDDGLRYANERGKGIKIDRVRAVFKAIKVG
jgi:hypothetical protein